MADNNNNNSHEITGKGAHAASACDAYQSDVEKSLAAVDNWLNNLEAGDATAAGALQHAVQEACHVIQLAANTAQNNPNISLNQSVILKSLKALLSRVDGMHQDMQQQLSELQSLMGNTNNASHASKAYLKASYSHNINNTEGE